MPNARGPRACLIAVASVATLTLLSPLAASPVQAVPQRAACIPLDPDGIPGCDSLVGITHHPSAPLPRALLDADIQAAIDARQRARKERNFKESDKIRDELLSKGIVLEDTPKGVVWKRR